MSEDVRAYDSGGAATNAAGRTDDRPATTAPALPSGSPEETARLFEDGVRAHSRRLLAIARAVIGNSSRASPEDVVQQALTNLYQHRARYDWHEPGGLFKRAVVNEALRILRQPKMSIV